MARMGFLHELVGEEFRIRPVHLATPDAAALKLMVGDLTALQKEITRRRNQLQQITASTFPELKTFFRNSTASPTARAVLARFPTPQLLAEATTEEIAAVLRAARAYPHAARAADLKALAEASAGVRQLGQQHWRQGWLLTQLDVLVEARQALIDQMRRITADHPYTPLIESLPVTSPIWTASLIALIGDVQRFGNYGQFRAHVGWFPNVARSGASVDASRLADRGSRLGRKVLGQMVLILIAPSTRATPFRAYYERLKARGMRPATACGHVAGKLASVLYGLLKDGTAYDEARHWRALGLVPPPSAMGPGTSAAPIEVAASREVEAVEFESAAPAHPQAVPTPSSATISPT